MNLDVMREKGITCNDCFLAIQNCNDRSICCEDETGLCDSFEPNDIDMFLQDKTIIKAEVDGFGIKLYLDDGNVFDYDSSDGGYSGWEVYKNE